VSQKRVVVIAHGGPCKLEGPPQRCTVQTNKQTYRCTFHSAATLVTAVDQNFCEAINNVYTAEIPTKAS